jgi:hypothetical protein
MESSCILTEGSFQVKFRIKKSKLTLEEVTKTLMGSNSTLSLTSALDGDGWLTLYPRE